MTNKISVSQILRSLLGMKNGGSNMEVGFVWKDHHLQGARMNLCQNWLVPEWAFSNRRWQKSVQGFLQRLVKMRKS